MVFAEAQVEIQESQIEELKRDLEKARNEMTARLKVDASRTVEVVDTVVSTITGASDGIKSALAEIQRENDQKLERLREEHEQYRREQDRKIEQILAKYADLVFQSGNELAFSRITLCQVRDQTQRIVYLATEGADGEGDDMAIAHHQERDKVASEMARMYENDEDLMTHPAMAPPRGKGGN